MKFFYLCIYCCHIFIIFDRRRINSCLIQNIFSAYKCIYHYSFLLYWNTICKIADLAAIQCFISKLFFKVLSLFILKIRSQIFNIIRSNIGCST